MKELIINIAEQFSPWAGGRFPTDGSFSGERFRKEKLIPAIENDSLENVIVSLDGLIGLGSSFKEEAFGGLIREGISIETIKRKLSVIGEIDADITEIWSYIDDANSRM